MPKSEVVIDPFLTNLLLIFCSVLTMGKPLLQLHSNNWFSFVENKTKQKTSKPKQDGITFLIDKSIIPMIALSEQ